jgi:hypothetical protein
VQRHVPTAEVDDLGAEPNMGVVKRSLKGHRNLTSKRIQKLEHFHASPLCP